MKDEFADLMHSEFFTDPDEKMKILIMSAFSRIRRGEPKSSVLQRLGLTEKEYDENVGRVFLD